MVYRTAREFDDESEALSWSGVKNGVKKAAHAAGNVINTVTPAVSAAANLVSSISPFLPHKAAREVVARALLE